MGSLSCGGAVTTQDGVKDNSMISIGMCQATFVPDLLIAEGDKAAARLHGDFGDVVVMGATIKPRMKFGICEGIFLIASVMNEQGGLAMQALEYMPFFGSHTFCGEPGANGFHLGQAFDHRVKIGCSD